MWLDVFLHKWMRDLFCKYITNEYSVYQMLFWYQFEK